jgi:hypothetical protein
MIHYTSELAYAVRLAEGVLGHNNQRAAHASNGTRPAMMMPAEYESVLSMLRPASHCISAEPIQAMVPRAPEILP